MFVVAGSSGNTGSVVAELLLAQGKQVRVLARSADKVASLKARGAEVRELDLEDTALLADALRGAEGAYLLVPPNLRSQNVLEDQARVVASLCEAVRIAKPGHVVLLSSVAAHQPGGTGPIRTLHAAERALSAVTDQVTFVRAAYFMENFAAALGGLAEGVLPSFVTPELPVEMVATRDIGATAARALLEGPAGRQVIELDGPRAYTAHEVAAELSKLTNKTVNAVGAPESVLVETYVRFGIPRFTAELYLEMTHGINTGHVRHEGKGARHVRGGTPVAQVLAALLAR